MRSTLILIAWWISLMWAVAHAQQPSTPMETALGQKLMAEISASVQCGANQVTTLNQLQAAEARVKELEAKYEPKTEGKQ